MRTPQLHGKTIQEMTVEELKQYREAYKWFESMKEFVAAVEKELATR